MGSRLARVSSIPRFAISFSPQSDRFPSQRGAAKASRLRARDAESTDARRQGRQQESADAQRQGAPRLRLPATRRHGEALRRRTAARGARHGRDRDGATRRDEARRTSYVGKISTAPSIEARHCSRRHALLNGTRGLMHVLFFLVAPRWDKPSGTIMSMVAHCFSFARVPAAP